MRILVVIPSLEDTEGRGINVIAKNLIDGLGDAGHEVGLLVGMPKRKPVKELRLFDRKTEHLYLQHYVLEGKKSFRYFVRGGFSRFNVSKAMFRGDIYDVEEITLDPELLSPKRSLLHDVKFCIQAPFVYQLLNHNKRRQIHKVFRKITRQFTIDAVLSVAPADIYKEDLASHVKLIQFVHDFMPIEMLETPVENDTPITTSKNLYAACLQSDLVIVNSEDTKGKVLAANPEASVEVLYGAVKPPQETAVQSSILAQKNLQPGHYLVFASVLETRKNLVNIFEAYSLIFEDIHKMPLVLIGAPGYGFKEILEKYKSLPAEVRSHVIFTGYVSELDKMTLFQHARASVYTTLYEGLGIPVVEALACGTPVVTSDAGALREAGKDAALYVKNPYDPAQIAEGIREIVNNNALRAELLSRSDKVVAFFSSANFKKRIQETIRLIES